MKRSDFKIGFSKFTYMILHTTKQRTPVPTGVLCLKPYLIAVLLKHRTLLSQYFLSTGIPVYCSFPASAYMFNNISKLHAKKFFDYFWHLIHFTGCLMTYRCIADFFDRIRYFYIADLG